MAFTPEQITHFAKRSVELAQQGMLAGGGPFGAVVVNRQTGQIAGEGYNQVNLTQDPTLHGEVSAIRNACQTLGTWNLTGHVLFTSTYPCPMCFGAIHWANLDAVYYVCTDEDAARAGFDDANLWGKAKSGETFKPIFPVPTCLTAGQAVFTEWQTLLQQNPEKQYNPGGPSF